MGGIPQTPPPQLDLAKFCPEAARQNLAKSSRAFLEARNYLNYRGSAKFGPKFCRQRFGQIFRAKFGQIEPRISHRIRRSSPIWPNFARKLPGKIWPNRAAIDLAKFCRELSLRAKFGQIGPSERRSSIWPNFAGQPPGKIWPNRAAHFSWHTKSSPIWPNFARRLPGKIWPNRAAIV